MDNINIGYNFGKIFRNKATLQANFTAQNVFTITKYSGLDPEVLQAVNMVLITIFIQDQEFMLLGLNLNF